MLSTASDLVNTVGKQFAQPIRPRDKNNKPKGQVVNQMQKDRTLDVVQNFEKWIEKYSTSTVKSKNHKIFNLDFKKH